ncbi:hypothetical protein [Nakamurella endophytica]|uniref:Uncharacterized protein n=1 Tax=Nakamurella endophytica TaxID=1748367 RepID=A0A917T4K3_9ACTN|nr:hypothetical protein [Nakamurella endophytica]GGM10673.1 hypothetical protein GCM10011594_33270 [Nakamurella endophytica]
MRQEVYAEASTAAALRAAECRARSERLRAGGGATPDDAAQARERLAVARRRQEVAAARARSLAEQQAAARVLDEGARRVTAVDVLGPADLRTRMDALGCPLVDLWAAYLGLCGTCSPLELDAALHGALVLPGIEYRRLDQALWEMEHAL